MARFISLSVPCRIAGCENKAYPKARLCKRHYSREYYKRHKKKSNAATRRNHLLRRYGLTEQGYKDILEKYGNKCAICEKTPKERLRVDHSHGTGNVRGLLCHKCNTALGLFDDNEGRLLMAADYVRQHQLTGQVVDIYGECQ